MINQKQKKEKEEQKKKWNEREKTKRDKEDIVKKLVVTFLTQSRESTMQTKT
jgi:hypothetical protein